MLQLPPGAKRISSGMTGFYKRVFPVIAYAVVLSMVGVLWQVSRAAPGLWPWILAVPAFLAALFHFLTKILIQDLMDEVWDNGGELIVVNEGHVEHVALAGIMNISYSGITNPKRATLQLRKPARWGEKLAFIPVRSSIRILNLKGNEMIDELVRRVDEARRQA